MREPITSTSIPFTFNALSVPKLCTVSYTSGRTCHSNMAAYLACVRFCHCQGSSIWTN